MFCFLFSRGIFFSRKKVAKESGEKERKREIIIVTCVNRGYESVYFWCKIIFGVNFNRVWIFEKWLKLGLFISLNLETWAEKIGFKMEIKCNKNLKRGLMKWCKVFQIFILHQQSLKYIVFCAYFRKYTIDRRPENCTGFLLYSSRYNSSISFSISPIDIWEIHTGQHSWAISKSKQISNSLIYNYSLLPLSKEFLWLLCKFLVLS